MNVQADFDLLIQHGNVVLPGDVVRVDVGVREGKIVALAPSLPGTARRTIDAGQQLVFPGFIDAHTHMGIPIKETTSADDFSSGSVAAAFGGVTTILDFTVQQAGQSPRAALEERIALAQGKSHVDFGVHVNFTSEPLRYLREIPGLIADGFNSFKLFSTYREAGMMSTWPEFRAVMETVAAHGGVVLLHAESNEIIERETERYVNSGVTAAICHARSRPAEAEAEAIREAGAIARDLGARLYIVHLSSKAGLEAGLAARAQGAEIYLETCPQYLVLDESRYKGEKGHYYVTTPALRTRADGEALWEALAAGEIDVVGTDHCPFTREQKESADGVFYLTPNGMPGVETLFPLLYTYGVAEGRIDLARLVSVLAENPARIFGIDARKGAIALGRDADIIIWDPKAETTIEAPRLHGNADWSPYEGMRVAGRLTHTILRGQVLVEGEKFAEEDVFGELLTAPQPGTPRTRRGE
ncbi:MAG: dihydropyrimidinase [Anaerolineae bacterium]|nr:dihydropyrimidinase [Anaerolineae bacterium]